jgi:hypothetical protein
MKRREFASGLAARGEGAAADDPWARGVTSDQCDTRPRGGGAGAALGPFGWATLGE